MFSSAGYSVLFSLSIFFGFVGALERARTRVSLRLDFVRQALTFRSAGTSI